MTESAVPGDALENLSGTVAKLRKERDGLRRAMRNRAVIEQAKGILAERLSTSPEEAFSQLIELSTHSNVKLAELAAALVAGRSQGLDPAELDDVAGAEILTRFPSAATEVSGFAADLAQNLAEPTARQRLLAGRIEAALDYNEIAEAVAAATIDWSAPATVVIMLLDADGALRLAGSSGLPAESRSQWARVPPIQGLPMVEVVRMRRPLLIGDYDTLHNEFPATVAPNSAHGLAALPLICDGSVIGVIELFWERPHNLDDEGRANVLSLADPAARRCHELSTLGVDGLGGDDVVASPAVLPLVLEALSEPVVLLTPVLGEGEQIVDFRVEAASAVARELGEAEGLAGADGGLLTFLPHLGSRKLVPWLAEIASTGEPGSLAGLYVNAALEGTRRSYYIDLHATRLWDRILVTCRIRGEGELLQEQLLRSETVGRTGSFRWDMETGMTLWSPGLYRLVGREQRQGPLPFEEIGQLIDPADLTALVLAIDDTLAKGHELSMEVRGAGSVAGRRFVLDVTPSMEGETLTGVSGSCHELSETAANKNTRRKAPAELKPEANLAGLAAGSPRLDAPGFSVEGLVSGPAEPVLNCWYDTVPLPDGRVLVVVGEVNGAEGSERAGQRLRHAAVAYGLAGLTPDALLSALNGLSVRLEHGRTAAVTVAVVDAKNGTVTWAAAGQGAVIRCPDNGRGQIVPGALGLPLGSADGLAYSGNESPLSPGDRLVFYTSGLLSGAGVNPADALGALLSCEHAEPEQILADLRERAGTGLDVALALVSGTVAVLSGRGGNRRAHTH